MRAQYGMGDTWRKLVVSSALEAAAGFGFADASPLFEEKGDFALAALISQGEDPLFLHRPGACSAFSADDHPTDAAQVQMSNVFQKRFDGQKANSGARRLEIGDARDAVFLVLDADTPPDVGLFSGKMELRIQKTAEAIGALCKDLIGVPVGLGHDGGDGDDVIVRNEIVEEIAHGVYENHFGLPPA